jgi:iron complex transport system substrate-binding protein
MVVDAMYLFPEAHSRLVAFERITQGRGNYLEIIDENYKEKKILPVDVGIEQIASHKPDAVILKSALAQKLGTPLESLGINVVYLDFETPEQYNRDIRTLGGLFQNRPRAEEIVTYFNEKTFRIGKALSSVRDNQKPRVLLLYYSERDGKIAFNIPPARWMQTMLVELAGGYPVWKDTKLGRGWTKIGFEQIAVWDADIIFITAYFNDVEDIVKQLNADFRWQALKSLKKGQLYAFPADFYSWDQPTPRWILGLIWMANKIHPENLQDFNIMEEISTFYRKMYSLEEEQYFRHVHPILKGDLP